MNHIHRLTAELAEANAKLAAIEERRREFEVHLASPKFSSEGPLQDYINVKDVSRWLAYMNASE